MWKSLCSGYIGITHFDVIENFLPAWDLTLLKNIRLGCEIAIKKLNICQHNFDVTYDSPSPGDKNSDGSQPLTCCRPSCYALCWRQCWTGGNSGGGHCRWLVSMERRDEQDNIHLLHNTESGTWILNRWCPPWIIPYARAAQFYFRPADYLPVHFGLNFLNPSYI